MKLSAKLIAFVMLGVIALLFIDSFFAVKREVALFDDDMERDALHLGGVLAELTVDVWSQRGPDSARELVRRVNRGEGRIEIRLVWLDAPPSDPGAPRVGAEMLTPLREGLPVSVKRAGGGGPGYRYTYVPVDVGINRLGAIEITESLSALVLYTRGTVMKAVVLGILVLLVGSLALWLLGVHLVGRPLKVLVDKTHRIGRGDLAGDVVIHGRDELSSLASAMNQMCRELEEGRAAVQSETEARIATLEQLRHSDRLATVGRIAAGIAHELGTPLNVVSGRARLIADEGLSHDEVLSSAKIIEQQAGRMARIIRELLDFARRPSGRKTNESIDNIVREAVVMLAPDAQKKRVQVEVVEKTPLPRMFVDRAHIEQVFMNVLVNGIQAMPRGGRIEVQLMVEEARPRSMPELRARDCVIVRVLDEGDGIPSDKLEMIFEPFYTTKPSGEGTGLGLAVVKGIVEEHGGWVDVESEVGRGTRFTIFLPVEAAK
jgi:two-component system NtrC family sensor kinase